MEEVSDVTLTRGQESSDQRNRGKWRTLQEFSIGEGLVSTNLGNSRQCMQKLAPSSILVTVQERIVRVSTINM